MLRKRAPAAYTPKLLWSALWSPWKRSELTPWSVPAVNSHFGRGPKKQKPRVARSSDKVALGLDAVKSLFASAVEYHARVPDQRDATLEP